MIRRICAVDASYRNSRVVAVATQFIDGVMAEQSVYSGRFTFPYVSGLFYLHEGPSAVEAIKRLGETPQLLCFDAHGAAHPRGAGLSVVCGMILGVPSIGIAKSLLVGKVVKRKGERRVVILKGRVVGIVTGTGSRARYWSPGFSVDIQRLRAVIDGHSETCLKAMDESHRLSNATIRATTRSIGGSL